MIEGLLIYNKEDYLKNKVYSELLIKYGRENGLELSLIFKEELRFLIQSNRLCVKQNGKLLENITFVINRTRDSEIGEHFQLMGSKVYNSPRVTRIANDKALTHQHMSALGINTLDTFLFDKSFCLVEEIESYPVIIKQVDGHGGQQVYKVCNESEARYALKAIKGNKVVIQQVCRGMAQDIRVFVVGKKIIGAIKRSTTKGFKANYTLGADIEAVELSRENIEQVEKIIAYLKPGYVGIDFLVDENGELWFNEVEDVVGSRSLYQCTDVDSALCYIEYITKELS